MSSSALHALPAGGWMTENIGLTATSNPETVVAYASGFGSVSNRDGGSVWPVTARVDSGTFSMTAAEAPLHTDAQYRDDPEDAFVLACVRPACTGGDSVILSVADLVETLAARPDWLALKSVLTAPIWRWRTPAVFGGPSSNTPVPVLNYRGDGSPVMRWRFDNLIRDERYSWAAEIVAHVAATHPSTKLLRLEAGQVLVCDNTTVLHGRTAFTDSRRMLWRVRVHR